ncbi:MAG: hypothetical protein MRJ92_11760 [Nitrospira sp.]|nr:hypothetical protein [Nitrospira sp.]
MGLSRIEQQGRGQAEGELIPQLFHGHIALGHLCLEEFDKSFLASARLVFLLIKRTAKAGHLVVPAGDFRFRDRWPAVWLRRDPPVSDLGRRRHLLMLTIFDPCR